MIQDSLSSMHLRSLGKHTFAPTTAAVCDRNFGKSAFPRCSAAPSRSSPRMGGRVLLLTTLEREEMAGEGEEDDDEDDELAGKDELEKAPAEGPPPIGCCGCGGSCCCVSAVLAERTKKSIANRNKDDCTLKSLSSAVQLMLPYALPLSSLLPLSLLLSNTCSFGWNHFT